MPTVSVPERLVQRLVGDAPDESEKRRRFEELCFAFGLEVDNVIEENGRTVHRVDVPANRYDLLSAEGIFTTLSRFESPDVPQRHPDVRVPDTPHELHVRQSVNGVRPYVVSAVIRNASINVPSFIDCQDKLNINLGRRRQLIAIGTHELKRVSFPVVYEALPPDEIHFVPLKSVQEYEEGVVPSGRQVVSDLAKHQQLREYVGLLEGKEVYPVIVNGADHEILSMPPLVNSDYSKHAYTFGGDEDEDQLMDIFIEITATDLTRAHMALEILLYNYAVSEGCWVEPVDVIYEEPTELVLKTLPRCSGAVSVDHCPRLRWNVFELHTANVKRLLGVELEPGWIKTELERMGMLVSEEAKTIYVGSEFSIAGNKLIRGTTPKASLEPCEVVAAETRGGHCLTVFIPPYRTDIIHEVDVIEDVGISYGYNNIERHQEGLAKCTVDSIISEGAALLPRTVLTEYLRRLLLAAGYTEMLTFSLNNKTREYHGTPDAPRELFEDEISCFFFPGMSNIPLKNPKSTHFTHLRGSLITGMLKTIKCNLQRAKPLQFFEVGDVVCVSPTDTRVCDTNANPRIQQRMHCAVARAAQSDGFEYVRGVMDLIECKVVPARMHLSLEEHPIPVFAERRSALVVCEDESSGKRQVCGVIGVVAPSILESMKITFPVSYLEFDAQYFV